ncbi:MAG: phenylalanine--tRNA ligase subunit beta [bacterium]
MALRVPLKWLSDYVDIDLAPQDLAERLTLAGLEVESVEALGNQWHPELMRVGEVRRIEGHPNADRLCLAEVEFGGETPLTVVTGAPNLLHYRETPLPEAPLKVPFAMVGAELIDGHAGDGRKLKLKAGKIRGVVSEGMVCSERELGLSDEHEGILILPGDAPTGAPLVDYLGDTVLEFDIKGGFAHLMCVYGVARETAALTGKSLRDQVLATDREKVTDGGAETDFIRLEIADSDLCGRYTATLIEGIIVRPSPFWLQQRLIHAGLRPINAVVDATNYVMLELGQPLHAFDHETLRPEGGKRGVPLIRVRPAHAGEKMRTLDDVERTFDDRMLLITDGGGPVGLGGVMGGLNSEISENTTSVLLESANFDFLNTRRTSQLLKLRSEAGDRFGKRLDPGLALTANLRCAFLIAELCGGSVRPKYADLFPRPREVSTIDLEPAFVERLLGIRMERGEMVRILEALEFTVAVPSEEGDPLRVTAPSHRMDISIPADLVEEIGRIHGYDRMPHTLIGDEMPPQKRNRPLDGAERIRDLLTGSGLDEIITYSMVSLSDEAKLDPEGGTVDGEHYLALQNPLSAERTHLRRRLLAEGLNTMRNNLRFTRRVTVFELGAVFHPKSGAVLPDEPLRLCALLTGPREPTSWLAGAEPPRFDFYDVKGVAEGLLAGLEVEQVTWEPGDESAYHPGRSARVLARGEPLGTVGELHPRVAAAFDLPPQPVCALELDADALLRHWRDDRQMEGLSSHPPIYEDLAFVVAEAVPAEQVRALIAQTGRPLVREVALFDLYRGEQAGAGRKSLAYALTYQADDRTLTDGEVAKVRGRIVKRLQKELGAELRG